MVKGPEDFTKVENKFKLSLLQTDKRIVDLETALSEIIEKLKDTDLSSVNELKQRLEDLEDLVMVEQAGINELKAFLEGVGKKITEMKQPELQLPSNLEERLNKVEQSLSELRQILSSIPDIKSAESELRNFTDSFRTDMNLKAQDLEKDIAYIKDQLKMPLQQAAVDELKNIRNDWLVNQARVDAIEKFVQDFGKEVNEIKSLAAKFETFEKITDLSGELGAKIEQFKVIENEIRRLSSRVESIYKNIDDRIDKMTEAEKKLPEIIDSISKLSKGIDKNRIDILDRVKKEEAIGIMKSVDEKVNLIENKLSSLKKDDIGNLLRSMDEKYNATVKSVDERIDTVDKRIESIRRLEDGLKKLDEDRKLVEGVFKKMDEVQQGINRRFGELQSRMKTVTPEDVNSIILNKVSEIHAPLSLINDQLSDLSERLVFLESRLAAIEKTVEDSIKTQPIVLE